jgi:hypothetical protein
MTDRRCENFGCFLRLHFVVPVCQAQQQQAPNTPEHKAERARIHYAVHLQARRLAVHIPGATSTPAAAYTRLHFEHNALLLPKVVRTLMPLLPRAAFDVSAATRRCPSPLTARLFLQRAQHCSHNAPSKCTHTSIPEATLQNIILLH